MLGAAGRQESGTPRLSIFPPSNSIQRLTQVFTTQTKRGHGDIKGTFASAWLYAVNEATLYGARGRRGFLDHCVGREPRVIIFANMYAQASNFVFTIFGTIVLSSLLFIGVQTAAFLLARYFLSAALCRLILMFEFSGMVAVENELYPARGVGPKLQG